MVIFSFFLVGVAAADDLTLVLSFESGTDDNDDIPPILPGSNLLFFPAPCCAEPLPVGVFGA